MNAVDDGGQSAPKSHDSSWSDAERDRLVASHQSAAQSFDKTIVTLASGALGLSIAFVDKIVSGPEHSWTIITAWGLFAGSLVVVLVSFMTSMKAHVALIRQIDINVDEITTSAWGKATDWLNGAATALLVAGVVLLIVFAGLNFER